MRCVRAEIDFYVNDEVESDELHRLVGRLADSLENGSYGPDKNEVVIADEGVNYSWKFDTTGQEDQG
jgi:hypothetical protein